MVNTRKVKAPLLYKGAGPGTYWHMCDAMVQGFAGGTLVATPNAVLQHIGLYSFPSAFLSFSTSFAVAREYALSGPGGLATVQAPGYVYTVDLSQISGAIPLIDPIQGICSGANGTFAHDHNGGPSLMSEVAKGSTIFSPAHQPGSGPLMTPAVSLALKALIYAIRDAEVLIAATVPRGAVTHKQPVY